MDLAKFQPYKRDISGYCIEQE